MPLPFRKEHKTRVYCERGHRIKKVRNTWSQRRRCWCRGHDRYQKSFSDDRSTAFVDAFRKPYLETSGHLWSIYWDAVGQQARTGQHYGSLQDSNSWPSREL